MQLRHLISAPGLTSVGITAGAALGVALVSAALILTTVAISSRNSVDVGTAILALLVGAGWVTGTGVNGTVQGASLFGQQLDAGTSVGALALGTLTAIIVLLAVVGRIRTAADGSASASFPVLLGRTAIESAAIALVITLITAIPSVTLGTGGTGLVLRSNGLGTFVVSTIAITVGLLIGRLGARASLRLPDLAGFGPALRETGTMVMAAALVFGVIALVGGTIFLVTRDQPLTAVGLLPFLGNAAGFIASLAALGGITASSSLSSSRVLWAGDLLDGWGWLLPVVGLLLLAALAIRIGARRGTGSTVRWNRIWQLPVLALGVWLLLALMLLISVSAGVAIIAGGGTIGVAWWTPFLGAIWAGGLSLVAELAPRFAAELAPSLFALLAGRRGRDAWHTSGVGAAPIPTRAEPDASNTVAGPVAETTAVAPLADLAASSTVPPASDAIAVPVLSEKAKRGFVIGASTVGGLAVLIVAGFITVGILNAGRGPETAVRAYVDALSRGDAASAGQLVDPGIPNDQRVLLTNAALRSADHRLDVKSVRTMNSADSSATVETVLAVDGEAFTHTFTVDRGDNEFLVLNTWRVKTPLLTQLSLGATSSSHLLLGGISVPLGEGAHGLGGASGSVWVYPGTYTFTAPDSTYVTSSKSTVRVTDGSSAKSGYALVEQSPSKALKELVLKKAQERITACATVPTNVDDICPYPASSTDLTSLSLRSQATQLDEITLNSFRTGEAVITTQGKPFFGYTPAPRDTSFSLSGEIKFIDDQPQVTFTYAY